jgi:hypothetical protein
MFQTTNQYNLNSYDINRMMSSYTSYTSHLYPINITMMCFSPLSAQLQPGPQDGPVARNGPGAAASNRREHLNQMRPPGQRGNNRKNGDFFHKKQKGLNGIEMHPADADL